MNKKIKLYLISEIRKLKATSETTTDQIIQICSNIAKEKKANHFIVVVDEKEEYNYSNTGLKYNG